MDWEKIKLGSWSAIGGAILLAVVGFNWGGWVTAGTAASMASGAATEAVTQRLGSICVAQFDIASNKEQNLQEMNAKDPWDKARYIEKQTWAIMPGEKSPESGVAEACAKQLVAKAQ